MINSNNDSFENLFSFVTQSIQEKERIKKEYLKNEPKKYSIFRLNSDSLLLSIAKHLEGKSKSSNETLTYQYNLVYSFIRTYFVISDLIFNSDLIEAHILIRKQMETLTRLHELDKKPIAKLLKKTPNVLNLFGNAGRPLYPKLSEIAHFSSIEVGNFISFKTAEGKIEPSLFPFYNKASLYCYDKHAFISLYFMHWLKEFVKKTNNESYKLTDNESNFDKVVEMAFECSIVK